MGHLSVLKWLRVHCAFVQRSTADDQIDCYDQVIQRTIRMLKEIFEKLKNEGDPATGRWCVDLVLL